MKHHAIVKAKVENDDNSGDIDVSSSGKKNSSGGSKSAGNKNINRNIVINYNGGHDNVPAKLFHLMNSKQSSLSSTISVHPFKEINTLLLKIDNDNSDIYNSDSIIMTNRYILSQSSSFTTITERTILSLIHTCCDSLPIIRAKAIRTLLQLMMVDEDLIKRDSIRVTITNRLFDKAISVREETVKLLGYYVIKGRVGVTDDAISYSDYMTNHIFNISHQYYL